MGPETMFRGPGQNRRSPAGPQFSVGSENWCANPQSTRPPKRFSPSHVHRPPLPWLRCRRHATDGRPRRGCSWAFPCHTRGRRERGTRHGNRCRGRSRRRRRAQPHRPILERPSRFRRRHAGTDCRVCLGRFEPESVVNRLPCGHLFHRSCMETWLDYDHATYLLCRHGLHTGADDSPPVPSPALAPRLVTKPDRSA
jgi:hypothetical protein